MVAQEVWGWKRSSNTRITPRCRLWEFRIGGCQVRATWQQVAWRNGKAPLPVGTNWRPRELSRGGRQAAHFFVCAERRRLFLALLENPLIDVRLLPGRNEAIVPKQPASQSKWLIVKNEVGFDFVRRLAESQPKFSDETLGLVGFDALDLDEAIVNYSPEVCALRCHIGKIFLTWRLKMEFEV